MNTPRILFHSLPRHFQYPPPTSVVLQRFRLDVTLHTAPCFIHLIGHGLIAVIDSRLLQIDWVLGLRQRTVDGGLILEGRRGGRPGHTCQSGALCLRTRPWHYGSANQRSGPLSRQGSPTQGRKPAGEQCGNLSKNRRDEGMKLVYRFWLNLDFLFWISKFHCNSSLISLSEGQSSLIMQL